MRKQRTDVTPIRQSTPASEDDIQVADLAFNLWLVGGVRDGSPEECLLTAVLEVSKHKLAGFPSVPRYNAKRRSIEAGGSIVRDFGRRWKSCNIDERE
jgi:hypothetical protein